ncbi:uncharacterized protein BX663DRAFT_527809 [Cokeromyces recurvatus]|uniref:uncharacterized protein n=1 Tax=Cokeromyces recurvatus TaxID=90255 RepID=UPI00222002E3|nr:uncharacterized protein BX663DRAFT_527809 [Cokeromyces recurvatus]KAI7897553.1 hypothetical protein BX663DRAFT_527809 [Cokeromyces recurvatus]
MSQWETIRAKSSHISPVKLSMSKSHLNNNDERLFEAVSKTSIQTTLNNQSKPIHKNNSSLLKRAIIKLFLFILCGSFIFSFWYCYREKETSTCKHIYQTYNDLNQLTQSWISHSKERTEGWLNDPLYQHSVNQIQSVYHWLDTTSVRTAMQEIQTWVRSFIYTSDNQVYIIQAARNTYTNHIVPYWYKIKAFISIQLRQWRHDFDQYVESGSSKRALRIDDMSQDQTVEDRLRKTAKRILDYIDQMNQDSIKTGLKREQAREKAKQMIKGITLETPKRPSTTDPISTDAADLIAFEIQSIMDLASLEKEQLNKQLDLIWERLQFLTKDDNVEFFVQALKTEVDRLRASAENNVRERAKLGFEKLQKMKVNPIVKGRMKENIQTAQRAALKDLRKMYVKLYETNKKIEQLL